MDNYYCQRSTTFASIKCESRSTMLPHLKIKFNLSFQTQQSNYILNQLDSPTAPHLLESLPPSYFTIAAAVTAQNSLSCAHVREKLEEAIGRRLLDDERACVIKRAWREVREILPDGNLPLYTILYLNFKIRLTHSHVYVAEGGDHTCPRMVPAADSSLGMLKKCDEAEERCCCICLEELDGVASMMPCSHLFHGGCIEEWLRRSHYCPLCRYEMPTE